VAPRAGGRNIIRLERMDEAGLLGRSAEVKGQSPPFFTFLSGLSDPQTSGGRSRIVRPQPLSKTPSAHKALHWPGAHSGLIRMRAIGALDERTVGFLILYACGLKPKELSAMHDAIAIEGKI
jgi:hypothetical protein